MATKSMRGITATSLGAVNGALIWYFVDSATHKNWKVAAAEGVGLAAVSLYTVYRLRKENQARRVAELDLLRRSGPCND